MTDFFDVPRTTAGAGGDACQLPLLYRDGSQFGVFYAVDLARARQLVSSQAIEPWPVLGRAFAAIYVWEYRDSSIGSYGEVGLGIQCRRVGSRPSLPRLGLDMGAQDDQGIWVVSLPVTTQAAFGAGVEIWGYPKYVAPITTRFRHDGASVTLADELDLSIGALHGPSLGGQPVITMTERKGRLLRTRIDVQHRARWGSGRSARLVLRADGPTSRAASALGLDEMKPVAAFRVDRFQARLGEGVDLGPADRR